jgi:hypothetical protein
LALICGGELSRVIRYIVTQRAYPRERLHSIAAARLRPV